MLIDHKRKTINVWWMDDPSPGNFGDMVTPWLIEYVYGYTPIYTFPKYIDDTFIGFYDYVLLGAGSIIDFTSRDTTVWGSGMISLDSIPSSSASYLAVRGPITRDLLNFHGISCPAVFGDPALLLPHYYKRKVSPTYAIGIFPHYVDYQKTLAWYGNNPNIKIINPLNNDITEVLDDLFQCEKIISSSLHGIIIANAYGMPVTWVKFSNKLYGDDTKFQDHFAAMNVHHQYTQFYEKLPTEDLPKLNYFKSDEFDTNPLLKAFPVKI